MNSTNLTSFFTFGLGIVAGTFGAIGMNGVDPGGDYLKIYLTIVTAMLGATLGLVGSRLMDRITDRRRVRRRIQVVRLYINELLEAWRELQARIAKVAENGEVKLVQHGQPHKGRINYLLTALDMIRRASVTPPGVEEIIETTDDLRHAKAIGYVFKLSQRAETDGMQDWTIKKSLEFVDSFMNSKIEEAITESIDTLEAADKHFEARAR